MHCVEVRSSAGKKKKMYLLRDYVLQNWQLMMMFIIENRAHIDQVREMTARTGNRALRVTKTVMQLLKKG